MHTEQNPGDTRHKLPIVLFQGSHGNSAYLLPATMHGNMFRVLQAREAHPNLGVQGFYWGSVI